MSSPSPYALTTAAKTALPDDVPEGFLDLAVDYAERRLSLAQVAVLLQADIATVDQWLDDPAVVREIETQARARRASGAASRRDAQDLVDEGLARLRELVASGAAPASMIVKAVEVAAKVSGLTTEKAAVADARPTATLNINFHSVPNGGVSVEMKSQSRPRPEDVVDV